ncbi:hypothetical protein THAOC_29651 [Thalassiosira oceanica]|uniref:Uncharacterized protein n=1 Tax=Thalassiosira oceanica TaxID=159749 RepID=K0RBY7_THAOC|nr:hypothetical protein THAOC_29651 [Thalassiosira oceanica]|eukprot:EJK51198.1 hypothetical protein THAOC_29651 [Thalassiosira oceanica]
MKTDNKMMRGGRLPGRRGGWRGPCKNWAVGAGAGGADRRRGREAEPAQFLPCGADRPSRPRRGHANTAAADVTARKICRHGGGVGRSPPGRRETKPEGLQNLRPAGPASGRGKARTEYGLTLPPLAWLVQKEDLSRKMLGAERKWEAASAVATERSPQHFALRGSSSPAAHATTNS